MKRALLMHEKARARPKSHFEAFTQMKRRNTGVPADFIRISRRENNAITETNNQVETKSK